MVTVLTDDLLKGIAYQAAGMLKTDAVNTGTMRPVLAAYHHNEGVHRMRQVEEMFSSKLGRGWIDDPKSKGMVSHLLRECVKRWPPDAFIIATAANAFRPTPKLEERSHQEILKALNVGHSEHHRMVKEGLLTVRDALQVIVQTQVRVCVYVQAIEEKGWEELGPPDVKFFDQKYFGGRLKLYGPFDSERD